MPLCHPGKSRAPVRQRVTRNSVVEEVNRFPELAPERVGIDCVVDVVQPTKFVSTVVDEEISRGDGGSILGRTQRRRRTQCRLKCEILASRRRRIRGRVVTISEGGLAVVADLDLDQGDPIQLSIEPGVGKSPIRISAIVWNDLSASPSRDESRIRKLGCVVSEPPRAYLALLDSLVPSPLATRSVPIPLARPPSVDPAELEPDLPRSKEIQPPPKKEPEESLPYFRVRMKQIGGPRTRILTLRARSATQAERLALEELHRITSEADGWSVLHIARIV